MMKIGDTSVVRMKNITPDEIWEEVLKIAPDLEPFRRRGCVLRLDSLTTEMVSFGIIYGNEMLFGGKGTRTIADDWSIKLTRTA